MQYERRDFDLTPELRMDADATRIVGYAAVFNRYSSDLGGFVERILPGAFKRVLNRGDDVLALFNHSMDNLLATRSAGTLRLSEDETGLRYEFDLDADDPDHQRVIAKVKRGDLRGSSFAFRVGSDDDEWGTTDQDYPLRSIKSVSALRDVGPVSVPAYPDTQDAGRLALRSLAETVGRDVDELVAAGTDLRSFLVDLAKRRGGPVGDFSPYLVGEKGPEVFIKVSNPSTPDSGVDIKRALEISGIARETAQQTDDGSNGDTVPELTAPRTRHILPPRVNRDWWAQYQKGGHL